MRIFVFDGFMFSGLRLLKMKNRAYSAYWVFPFRTFFFWVSRRFFAADELMVVGI